MKLKVSFTGRTE